MADKDFIARLTGAALVTLHVEYWQPKKSEAEQMTLMLRESARQKGMITAALPAETAHSGLLNFFTWQTLDLAPAFPRIRQFLDFWSLELSPIAPIHNIYLGQDQLLRPVEVRHLVAEYKHGLH